MFTNTYQQGWTDALHKRSKPVNMSGEYRDGYMAGERYVIREKFTTLVAAGFLCFFIGVFMTLGIARLVDMPV